MITVHHLVRSRSERVIWLLEELGEPYELIAYLREPNMEAPAAYRTLHPVGASPIVDVDGQMLVESGAIIEYLAERYGAGRLAPAPGAPNRALYLQWMHFAEGGAAFGYIVETMMTLMAYGHELNRRQQPMMKLWRDRNERTTAYLNGVLARSPYFAGPEFTAADIMMSYVFGLYEGFVGKSLEGFDAIEAYRARIVARPAYVRSRELSGREPA